ncbi:hypothetical protein OESDEN_14485 [Oesophagostomum dentatum]|uniref:DDE Tnp4 domain-containing protein n=1 Tax=Oesophagostomum dentatum TaxID=61180 RepID=A0A0B1SRF5_OESDE|nr:hypothetical protein OESDEN_14485 [Oesophagostomum dentatum]
MIEKAMGCLKSQFCQLYDSLRYDPSKASRIIVAAVCMRNVAIYSRGPQLEEVSGVRHQWDEDTQEIGDGLGSGTARALQDRIITNYFHL